MEKTHLYDTVHTKLRTSIKAFAQNLDTHECIKYTIFQINALQQKSPRSGKKYFYRNEPHTTRIYNFLFASDCLSTKSSKSRGHI